MLDTVVTNDPMEATYVGIHMWKQAVEKAKSIEVDKVRKAMSGQTFKAPCGFTLEMDETNHHLRKPVMIGEIQGNGQFNVVWKTKGPIRAQPWSPFIPGNEKKQNIVGTRRDAALRKEGCRLPALSGSGPPGWLDPGRR